MLQTLKNPLHLLDDIQLIVALIDQIFPHKDSLLGRRLHNRKGIILLHVNNDITMTLDDYLLHFLFYSIYQ